MILDHTNHYKRKSGESKHTPHSCRKVVFALSDVYTIIMR